MDRHAVKLMIDSALALIDSIQDHRVLFVGDAIVDEYWYICPLGRSPKEPLIPVEFQNAEVFTGGVEAAARHLESFCSVSVCASPTAVRKVRMVDKVYFRKLFEIHYDDRVAPIESMPRMDYDAVVVTDFGHGAITPGLIEHLGRVPFLAVNAQTNASNVGFNLITKYSYALAGYIVIDEPEARLAAQDRESPIEAVISRLVQKTHCEKFVVTLGSRGAIGYDHGSLVRVPALTQKVVDTMGAGDAFFAVTAPMAKTGRMEDLIRIGNAAGALKTQIVGHREPVTKKTLIEYMKATWKDQ